MSQTYDAFTAGTELGGMRTKNDIRILLCYILRCLDVPFSRSDFNEALTSAALANFFEVNDALDALVAAGLASVEKRGAEDCFSLTPAGRETAQTLETDLPAHVRRKAVAYALEILAREKALGGTETRIEKLERGYHVILSVKDGDTLMLQTTLYAADSLQANSLCDAFEKQPGAFYSGVVELLTRE